MNERSELLALGWDDRWVALFAEVDLPGARPGRVVRHDGTRVLVAQPEVEALPIRGRVPLVVGDWVVVADGAVAAVLPRQSLLRRRDVMRDVEQPLAANVDGVFVVCGLDRPVTEGRLQRSVALSWDAGATPTVVLTKADLVEDPDAAVVEAEAAVPGVDVVAVSTRDGRGIDAVRAAATGRTIVLLGESGAGKSSLVNILLGGAEAAATGEVRAGDAKGRHTTTNRQIHLLPGGGVILDSPGIRAVGLWVDEEAVDAAFPEVEELAAGCRFRDCAHDEEPGCAVVAGLDDERLARWRALRREAMAIAQSIEDKRRAERRSGRMSREAQRMKGRRQP